MLVSFFDLADLKISTGCRALVYSSFKSFCLYAFLVLFHLIPVSKTNVQKQKAQGGDLVKTTGQNRSICGYALAMADETKRFRGCCVEALLG